MIHATQRSMACTQRSRHGTLRSRSLESGSRVGAWQGGVCAVGSSPPAVRKSWRASSMSRAGTLIGLWGRAGMWLRRTVCGRRWSGSSARRVRSCGSRPLRRGLLPSWAKSLDTGTASTSGRPSSPPRPRRLASSRTSSAPKTVKSWPWPTCVPLSVAPADWRAWLDPAHQDPDELRALLAAPAAGHFGARAVSTAVNNVRNKGPHLSTAPADDTGNA